MELPCSVENLPPLMFIDDTCWLDTMAVLPVNKDTVKEEIETVDPCSVETVMVDPCRVENVTALSTADETDVST